MKEWLEKFVKALDVGDGVCTGIIMLLALLVFVGRAMMRIVCVQLKGRPIQSAPKLLQNLVAGVDLNH